jgi:hypothetical protein
MEQASKCTTTKSSGWQKQCETWAQTNQPFEVYNIEVQHFKFCQEFCVQHNYRYEFQIRAEGLIAILAPLPEKPVN